MWRRMLQVSWKDRKTNAWIRQRVRVGISEEEGLLAQLRKRKMFICIFLGGVSILFTYSVKNLPVNKLSINVFTKQSF